MVSSVPSGSYSLSTSSSVGFPELLGDGFSEDILFKVEYPKVSQFSYNVWLGSLYLFPSSEEGSFSDES